MRHLGPCLLAAVLLSGCAGAPASGERTARHEHCRTATAFQNRVVENSWDTEMDLEDVMERNYGRALSPLFEARFAACLRTAGSTPLDQ